jgi:threonine aldolase
MVSFESDYICGAHPAVLKRLAETNYDNQHGYGTDVYCECAKEKIRKAIRESGGDGIDPEKLQVEFLVGGTQTNATVISSMLTDYEGVVSADTGHINSHESGAVEFTGHKILALPGENGKLRGGDLERLMEEFYGDENREHRVFPGMVYISHPTEYGTLYTLDELTQISGICRRYGMRLFVDGARLGYGLMSYNTDVTLEDIARLADVFYIGGTKVGAMFGEAVVFTKGNRPAHFMTSVKKRGALLAKGWLLGVQFDALFTDGLYFEIGRHAIDLAERLKEIFAQRGFRFWIDSDTNQQFVILENGFMKRLGEKIVSGFWSKYDEEHTVVRFVTGWSTTEADLDALEAALDECRG